MYDGGEGACVLATPGHSQESMKPGMLIPHPSSADSCFCTYHVIPKCIQVLVGACRAAERPTRSKKTRS